MTDFSIFRGDTVSLDVTVTASGSAYNLTGCSMWFTAKQRYSDLDAAAVFQKSTGSGITITSPTFGQATVVISPSDTSGLSNVKQLLLYDLQVKDASGNIYTVASGNLVVYPEVTLSS